MGSSHAGASRARGQRQGGPDDGPLDPSRDE
jgi:hypothetical protein